ncbi:MAG: hypothetical protein WCG19_04575 [Chlorobiaceae bacterium]
MSKGLSLLTRVLNKGCQFGGVVLLYYIDDLPVSWGGRELAAGKDVEL